MLLYNVTVIVEDNAEQAWLQWMQETHIPEVMSTGKFVSNRLLKLLDSPNEGVTYCVQYIVETIEDYNEYQEKYAPALQQKTLDKFENQFVAFRSLMKYVD